MPFHYMSLKEFLSQPKLEMEINTKDIKNNDHYYAVKEELMIRKVYYNATPEKIGFIMIQCSQMLKWMKDNQLYLGDMQIVLDLDSF